MLCRLGYCLVMNLFCPGNQLGFQREDGGTKYTTENAHRDTISLEAYTCVHCLSLCACPAGSLRTIYRRSIVERNQQAFDQTGGVANRVLS